MAWVSVAAEMPNFTDGRPSFTGYLTLQCVVAGLVLWGGLEHVRPALFARCGARAPLAAAMLCLLLPLAAGSPLYVPATALYGISCGVFLGSSLTGYLDSGDTCGRLVKIGISAGVYTTAVYPFGVAYTLLASWLPAAALRFGAYILLCVLAVLVARLRRDPVQAASTPPELPPYGKRRGVTAAMLTLIVLFTVFNHLLLVGVLEQNGGTFRAPWVYFANVALRLPMGFLIGWFAHRGRWYYAVGLPLALMVAGCAVSLVSGGGRVGDTAMLGVFNCGGAAFVMLVHALGMQAALWRGRRALAASAGSLLHFTLTSFLNVDALRITPEFFGRVMRQPLTFLVIVSSLPLFLLIMIVLVNHKLMTVADTFFTLQANPAPLPAPREPPPAPAGDERFSAFERRIAALLIDGLSQSEIARRLHRPAGEVRETLRALRDKVDGNDPDVRAAAALSERYKLTRRETDMLRGLRRGLTNAEIAAELQLSEETIRIHVRNLIKKLPVENRQSVAAWVESQID
jgi:DNA-binding NarL/FixJ family response regulator